MYRYSFLVFGFGGARIDACGFGFGCWGRKAEKVAKWFVRKVWSVEGWLASLVFWLSGEVGVRKSIRRVIVFVSVR
jgi:hypothetical protein